MPWALLGKIAVASAVIETVVKVGVAIYDNYQLKKAVEATNTPSEKSEEKASA